MRDPQGMTATDMKAGKDRVVSFDYVLRDENGEAMESSEQSGPMAYLHGAGNIIPGLEQALEGHEAGDQFQVEIEPQDAYGEHDARLIQRVPLKRLKGAGGKVRAGDVLRIQTSQGSQMVRVLKVGRFHADLDGNHPLAGRTLNFDVTVKEVREASDEERSHGHAHGPGGHEHD